VEVVQLEFLGIDEAQPILIADADVRACLDRGWIWRWRRCERHGWLTGGFQLHGHRPSA
jgi:hypothetical protein